MRDQSSLRASVLEKRRGIERELRRKASAQALERLMAAWRREAVPGGLSIGIYRSMPEEIDLEPVLLWLESVGHRLYFPRITDFASCQMEWASARVSELSSWSKGRYSILEPCSDIQGAAYPHLDVIFVPGVVFGEAGERIGMGKGFYDRVLPYLPDAIRIALAFDFQIVPTIPQNSWDQRVHWIFSETREIQACPVQGRVGQLSR